MPAHARHVSLVLPLVAGVAALLFLLGMSLSAPRPVAAAGFQQLLNPHECSNWGKNNVWLLSHEEETDDDLIDRDSVSGRSWEADPINTARLEVPALHILQNDRLVLLNSGALIPSTQVRLFSYPSHATAFQLNANGSFSYTPADGFYGEDSFQYVWFRSNYCSDPATVTISASHQPR